jgi:PAS domain S-box-containing protein
MFGFEHAKEYEGKTARVLYDSEEEYERVGKVLYRNIRHGAVTETDTIMRRTDGTLFHAHVRASLTGSSDTTSPSVITAISDMSEWKRAEGSLKEALKQLRRSDRENQALLKGAAALLEYHSFRDAARHLLDSCRESIGATIGYVGLVTKDGAEVEFVCPGPGALSCSVDLSLSMPVRGLKGKVSQDARPVYEKDFRNSVWTNLVPKGHVDLNNVLFAPLALDGKTVGLLGLANKAGGFDDHDAELA